MEGVHITVEACLLGCDLVPLFLSQKRKSNNLLFLFPSPFYERFLFLCFLCRVWQVIASFV